MGRRGSFAVLGLLVALLSASSGADDGRSPAPSDSALLLVRGLEPERMGVDSVGHLWTLHDDEVTFVSRQGAVVGRLTLGEAPQAVDADSRWGLATLDAHGTKLSVVSPEGYPVVEIELPDEAAHLAWMDARTVALGLTRADRAVEIRTLRGGTAPVRLWPVLAPPSRAPSFLHSIVLDADPAERLLYALDSVYGELRVFTYAGEERRRLKLPGSPPTANRCPAPPWSWSSSGSSPPAAGGWPATARDASSRAGCRRAATGSVPRRRALHREGWRSIWRRARRPACPRSSCWRHRGPSG